MPEKPTSNKKQIGAGRLVPALACGFICWAGVDASADRGGDRWCSCWRPGGRAGSRASKRREQSGSGIAHAAQSTCKCCWRQVRLLCSDLTRTEWGGWSESGVEFVGISTRHQRGSGVNTRLGFLSARYGFDLSTSLSDPGQRAEALPWPWQEGYTESVLF